MRSKIVIPLLLVGAAGLAVMLFLKIPVNRPQPPEPIMVQPVKPPTKTKPASPHIPPPAMPVATAAPAAPVPATTPEVAVESAPSVDDQIDRLQDLQANDDDASLQAILKELTNTNQLVRHAAIEATIQFGGHTAVPVLQDLAAHTSDPDEKQELLDAAEFLALPTLSEARAEMKQKKLQEAAQSPGAVPPQ